MTLNSDARCGSCCGWLAIRRPWQNYFCWFILVDRAHELQLHCIITFMALPQYNWQPYKIVDIPASRRPPYQFANCLLLDSCVWPLMVAYVCRLPLNTFGTVCQSALKWLSQWLLSKVSLKLIYSKNDRFWNRLNCYWQQLSGISSIS